MDKNHDKTISVDEFSNVFIEAESILQEKI